MADEHLKNLDAALVKMREHRRTLAENLAGDYARAHTEGWRDQLVQVQQTIDALLRAKDDERNLLPKVATSAPLSI
ncbi:hypothetical protein CO674_07245 [Rhizobium hidalgonense]|uniref:Uncharacterized protein n=1 Tax=Rhizobium hidalgonense TaxID=1538159 RepID=A0ABX4JWS8_9HYPH|nr:hypothetical protein CO674_07245 [Rhizobium hidalgonense]PON04860.1 hypothetical protein ATY29_25730 [Rhizobium hidalgonense]